MLANFQARNQNLSPSTQVKTQNPKVPINTSMFSLLEKRDPKYQSFKNSSQFTAQIHFIDTKSFYARYRHPHWFIHVKDS